MLQDHLCNLVELLLPLRIVVLLEPYEPLDLQLDRSQRILDLMGHLAGHLAPCLVTLGLRQPSGRVLEVPDHSVVGLHKR